MIIDHYSPIETSCEIVNQSALASSSFEDRPILKPRPLKKGDTIGIFTPSWPANIILKEKYLHSLNELRRMGFNILEGNLTSSSHAQNYRLGDPKRRAEELMELICNPAVQCVMATIGGWISASLIPFLDFDEIRKQRKIICGYSDITSLHLAILKRSRLSTFYGPSLVPVFGEYPTVFSYAYDSFFQAASLVSSIDLELKPPQFWSDHFIDATKGGWKEVKRKYQPNEGWKILLPGEAIRQRAIIANLETLLSLAGTEFFPDVSGYVLIIEETEANFSKTERNYRHLQLMKVFDKVTGLIISKPGKIDSEECPMSREELLKEIIGDRFYPIVTNFDCGHTFPMITLPQNILLSIDAKGNSPHIYINENAVEE